MRRSLTDPEWADEVIRRWQRRRWRIQQREAAWAGLKAAIEPPLLRLALWPDRQLRRWPRLYRWLSR